MAQFTESTEEKRKRTAEIVKRLRRMYPGSKSPLDHENPLQMLVATILSAQCTDKLVNEVTPALFRKYRDARAYANANPAELEEMIHATGFFRNKTKSLIGMGKALVAKHGGQVPETMEELLQVPGVARKTANVVLQEALRPKGPYDGVVVDTHVRRLAFRLGLSEATDPEKIERDLMALAPRKAWRDLGLDLIMHGRAVCAARKPQCPVCKLNDLCPKLGV